MREGRGMNIGHPAFLVVGKDFEQCWISSMTESAWPLGLPNVIFKVVEESTGKRKINYDFLSRAGSLKGSTYAGVQRYVDRKRTRPIDTHHRRYSGCGDNRSLEGEEDIICNHRRRAQ